MSDAENYAAIYPSSTCPKTPHHAAYLLAYELIIYGSLVDSDDNLKKILQEAIFHAALPLFEQVWPEEQRDE